MDSISRIATLTWNPKPQLLLATSDQDYLEIFKLDSVHFKPSRLCKTATHFKYNNNIA